MLPLGDSYQFTAKKYTQSLQNIKHAMQAMKIDRDRNKMLRVLFSLRNLLYHSLLE